MKIHYQIQRSPRWLGWLLAIPLLLLAALLGLFVLAGVLGLALLAAAVLGVRIWRMKRRLRRTQANQVLVGEYITVRESRRDHLSP